MNDDTAHFVLEAVDMVATHGWKLLPQVRKTSYTTSNLIIWLTFKIDINHEQCIQSHVLFIDLCPPVQCGTTIRSFPQAPCKRTLLANINTQHCWMLHGACVCTPCYMLLHKLWNWSKLLATCKRNNSQQCCRPFARGFREVWVRPDILLVQSLSHIRVKVHIFM